MIYGVRFTKTATPGKRLSKKAQIVGGGVWTV